jgi:NADH dehydrogenase
VEEIDLEQRLVKTSNRSFSYDYLILGTGSVAEYFGVPGALEHALPIKTLEESIAIRNHILSCFEQAVHEADQNHREMILTFVIIGGGPTGIELAGALIELVHGALAKDFTTLDTHDVHVILVEALPNLITGFPERLQNYAVRRLAKMGVDVRLSAPVAQIMSDAISLKDGTIIPTKTVVWAAGVRGNPEVKIFGLPHPTIRGGYVPVRPTLQIEGHPESYVVGDLSYFEERARRLPMIAPVAIQQGTHAAHNIMRQILGKPLENFRYRDRGNMATLGRNSGVAYLFGRTFTGFPAWIIWLGVHLYNLIGFRNRLFVLTDWAWDYLFYERTVRLIMSN